MTWKYIVAQTDGTTIGALTRATSRKVTFPLDDVASASFTINGQDSQALMPVELTTDLLIRDPKGILRFRGRMGSSQDAVAPGGMAAQMGAVDYRGLLDRRGQSLGPLSFTSRDQAFIAFSVITAAQAQDAGDLGITQGVGATTGVNRTIVFTDGASVAADINQLAALGDGFEWEIDQDLKLNVFYPQRGTDTAIVLKYGGTVVSFSRTLDTTKFANAVRFSGDSTTTTPTTVEGSGLPSSPTPDPGTPGRFETAVSDSTITNPGVLSLRSGYELSQDDQPPVSYQMVLRDGWWTPDELWIGDTCQLVLKAGRINEISRQRVTQIEIDSGDDGGDVVTVTTGPVPTDEEKDIARSLDRITRLELSQ